MCYLSFFRVLVILLSYNGWKELMGFLVMTINTLMRTEANSQSLAANGSKPRGPIKSCPFSLRSEERAAKRKEEWRLKGKDLSSGSQFQSNNNKVPPTGSQSQKLLRQSTTSKVLDQNTRPSVNSQSSKHVTQNHNARTSRSVTSLPKKNAHDNSSPNIQSSGCLV